MEAVVKRADMLMYEQKKAYYETKVLREVIRDRQDGGPGFLRRQGPCASRADALWRLPKNFLYETALLNEPSEETFRWNLRRED